MVSHEPTQRQMEREYDDLARSIRELTERHERSTLPIERQFLRRDLGYQRARLEDLQQRLRRDCPSSIQGFFPPPTVILSSSEGV